jgi:hypothetical protein
MLVPFSQTLFRNRSNESPVAQRASRGVWMKGVEADDEHVNESGKREWFRFSVSAFHFSVHAAALGRLPQVQQGRTRHSSNARAFRFGERQIRGWSLGMIGVRSQGKSERRRREIPCGLRHLVSARNEEREKFYW